MTIQNTNTSPPQYPPHGYYLAPVDEISLIDLWNVLVGRWQLIVATTFLAILIATFFALTASHIPLFRATTYFLPPTDREILPPSFIALQGIHKEQGVEGEDEDPVYSLFKNIFKSKILYNRYFNENHLEKSFVEGTPTTSSREEALSYFYSLFRFKSVEGEEKSSLSIEWYDPIEAADWVNGLTQMANILAIEQLHSNINDEVHKQIQSIENAIALKRKLARKSREDHIVRLREALQIADALGFKERSKLKTIYEDTLTPIEIYTTSYYRGSRALQVEIETLQNRSSDDPFITGLRELEEKLSQLRAITINNTTLSAYTLDQPATPPQQPINKQNRRFIVTLGGIIGLVGGIFLVFILNFIQNQKKNSEKD